MRVFSGFGDRTWPMAALDPNPKSTTDRYQGDQSNDGSKNNTTLPSRPNNTAGISYLLNAARPWGIHTVKLSYETV